MSEQREYRYTPPGAPGPCPKHPRCLVLRCARWLYPRTFHLPLTQRGRPRRYCIPGCRVAEHRGLQT